MRLAVIQQLPTGEARVLAVFALEDAEVQADWKAEDYRQELEEHGLPLDPETGRAFGPSDGQEFFDALPRVYARSSVVNVYNPDRPSRR